MILTRRARLGSNYLDELDERIVIRSVDPGRTQENIQTATRMGYAGQRVTGQRWESIEAKITYAIDIPKKEIAERRAVIDLVNQWALGKGWLRMTGMENRRLYVERVVLPTVNDLWDWTAEYTISFLAYNVPFWQDVTETAFTTGTAAGGSRTLDVPGNVRTVMNATFTNKSGKTIDTLTIDAGGNAIKLSGLGLSGSGQVVISHGNDGRLRITADGANVYAKYSGADDLYLDPGTRTVAFSASRAGILTASCCGRWVG